MLALMCGAGVVVGVGAAACCWARRRKTKKPDMYYSDKYYDEKKYARSPLRSPKSELDYSDKYYDEEFEYRHVHIPKELAKQVPKDRVMSEREWRGMGIKQSGDWVHYMIHGPERHVILFRRPRTDLLTGGGSNYRELSPGLESFLSGDHRPSATSTPARKFYD